MPTGTGEVVMGRSPAPDPARSPGGDCGALAPGDLLSGQRLEGLDGFQRGHCGRDDLGRRGGGRQSGHTPGSVTHGRRTCTRTDR